MKWLEREQSLLLREKQTKTNKNFKYPEISRNWFQDIFMCKIFYICGKLATMECDDHENKYFMKTIYTIL